MFLTRSEYDRGVNTFSPEGRLFQVEYAIEAIKLGTTALGIATNEGIVLAVEKRISSTLIVGKSMQKLVRLDEHIGANYILDITLNYIALRFILAIPLLKSISREWISHYIDASIIVVVYFACLVVSSGDRFRSAVESSYPSNC